MRRYIVRSLVAAFLMMALWSAPLTIQADHEGLIIPVLFDQLDTATFGSIVPQGLAFNLDTGNYLIVDSGTDELYTVTPDGSLVDQCDTAAFGSDFPTGVTYNTATGGIVIVDATDDEAYIVNATCGLLGSFETKSFGSDFPTGIAYNSDTNQYAVLDGTDVMIYILDTNGVPQDPPIDLSVCGATTRVNGIGYDPNSGEYLVVDWSPDEVFIVDALTGACVTQFDTANFGSGSAAGITYTPDSGLFAIADNSADEVFFVDARGSLVSHFDTTTLVPAGVNTPSGIAVVPGADLLAITDDTLDAIVFSDKAGNFVFQCATTPFFSSFPQSIEFVSSINQFAITDASTDETYFITSPPTCELQSQFDTAGFGSNTPYGLTFNNSTGGLVVQDNSDHTLYFTDLAGNLQGQLSTFPLFATSVYDIAYIPPSGNYAVLDAGTREIYIMNSYGLPEMQIDTSHFGATFPEGIDYDDATGELIIVDSNADEVYILDIPRALEPTTLSGTFRGIIPTAAVSLASQIGPQDVTLDFNIVEHGRGFFSGNATVPGFPGFSMPLAGYFDEGTSIMWMLLITPAGGIALPAGVSADLSALNFPSLGIFQRP